MPFREKSAWIWLICLLATFGVFFYAILNGFIRPRGMEGLHWFLVSIAIFIALQIILHVIAVATAPKDAAAPLDERERLIRLKAARNANYAFMVGLICIPLSLHMGVWAPEVGFVAMGTLFTGEVVRAASQIIYFRMGR